jgi:cbb3-type cytochrome oxidase maturation protein
MSVLWLVLPVALLLAAAAVAAFLWVVRTGQLDDLDTPGWRAVIDDDDPAGPGEVPAQESGGR